MMNELADKYNKKPSNIIIKWGVQRGIIMIPKSSNKGRIEENFHSFDFVLSDEDMASIRTLNNGKKLYSDPDNVNFD